MSHRLAWRARSFFPFTLNQHRAEAEGQYREALAIREKLAADFPAVTDYRKDLAGSHHNLGLLLAGLGKGPEAEQQYRKALAIKEKLAAEFPVDPEYRNDLALSRNNLGVLLADLGKGPEAEGQFRKALAIEETLIADFPAVPDYRKDLAGSHYNLGRPAGRPGEGGGGGGAVIARPWRSRRSWPLTSPPSQTTATSWAAATIAWGSCWPA